MTEKTEVEFKYYTQKAGDVARQLCFAGIAIIWLFHTAANGDGEAAKVAIPDHFKSSAGWLIAALVVDAAQYLAGSVLWGIALYMHPTGDAYSNQTANKAAIGLSTLLIAVKLILVSFAYWYLYDAVTGSTLWNTITPG